MNLFCLLSIRSAVVEFLKPLVEERRERERGEEGWGEERKERGGVGRGRPLNWCNIYQTHDKTQFNVGSPQVKVFATIIIPA